MNKKIIVLLFLLTTACTKTEILTGNSINEFTINENNNEKIEIYFCPRDDCQSKLLTKINQARTSIHCAFFDLELHEVKEKLREKNKDIDVKLFVDDKYYKKVNDFDFVKKDNKNQLSHNKFCIFDDKIVWTGSFNPTVRGNEKNNNNILVINSEYLAQNYETEFQELWHGTFGKGTTTKTPVIILNNIRIENYFCPDDGCKNQVVKTLNKAKDSIHFMTFSFTHEEIGNELIRKQRDGIKIKGIFEKSQNNKYNEKPFLDEENIQTSWDNNSANMHHKVFIVDEKIVITGSMNPTKNGDERNDENLLIIHDEDIADKYLKEFNLIYNYEQ